MRRNLLPYQHSSPDDQPTSTSKCMRTSPCFGIQHHKNECHRGRPSVIACLRFSKVALDRSMSSRTSFNFANSSFSSLLPTCAVGGLLVLLVRKERKGDSNDAHTSHQIPSSDQTNGQATLLLIALLAIPSEKDISTYRSTQWLRGYHRDWLWASVSHTYRLPAQRVGVCMGDAHIANVFPEQVTLT